MLTTTISFDAEFLPVEEEELFPPPWERPPGRWKLVRKRWPITLAFVTTNHRIMKPRKDMLEQEMSKGDRYFRIQTYVRGWLVGRAYEIKDQGQTEDQVFSQFAVKDEFRWECNFFRWSVQAQEQWQKSEEFMRFYLGSRAWTRTKTCTDCGKTAREIGLRSRAGHFRWFIAWDRPGQYRCDRCHLVYSIFGAKPPEQPPT